MWRYMKAYLQYGMPHIQFNVINNQIFVPLFMAQPIFELVYVHVKIVLDGCLVYRGAVTYNATYVDLVTVESTNRNNLDMNKNLNQIIIEIEIRNLKLKFGI